MDEVFPQLPCCVYLNDCVDVKRDYVMGAPLFCPCSSFQKSLSHLMKLFQEALLLLLHFNVKTVS